MHKAPEIITVILCGGESKRMGQAKSHLKYHGIPQYLHLMRLCANLGLNPVISCKPEQEATFVTQKYLVTDNPLYADAGPMTGLLSAMTAYPKNAIMLLACDYPLLRSEDIANLSSRFKQHKHTLSFYQEDKRILEPLLAVYNPKDFRKIQKHYKEGKTSLRNFLKESKALTINPVDPSVLRSFDTQEDFLSYPKPASV